MRFTINTTTHRNIESEALKDFNDYVQRLIYKDMSCDYYEGCNKKHGGRVFMLSDVANLIIEDGKYELIGEGTTSSVFRIDNNLVVKVLTSVALFVSDEFQEEEALIKMNGFDRTPNIYQRTVVKIINGVRENLYYDAIVIDSFENLEYGGYDLSSDSLNKTIGEDVNSWVVRWMDFARDERTPSGMIEFSKEGFELTKRLIGVIEKKYSPIYREILELQKLISDRYGIVHDDLHINNIMCNKDGRLSVIDFGGYAYTSELNDVEKFIYSSAKSSIRYATFWYHVRTLYHTLTDTIKMINRYMKDDKTIPNEIVSEAETIMHYMKSVSIEELLDSSNQSIDVSKLIDKIS